MSSVLATTDYEATLDRTVLHRCEPCASRGIITPHPLATGNPDGRCPVCGSPTRSTVLPTVDAIVQGIR